MNFRKFIQKLLPTNTVTRTVDIRQEPSAIAHTMSVDRLGSILRSAEAGDMEDFFSLARDLIAGHTHAQAEFSKRKLAVVGEDLVVTAYDKDDPADVALATAIKGHLENLDELLDIELHLLDSTLYPVSVVEKIYRPSTRAGWRYEIAELRIVPHRLLDWTSGALRIWDVDDSTGQRLGTTHEPDPIRYIVHRGHALTNIPDTWGGPMRAVMFWWLFSVMDRHWWARFLDRFGAPFMVAKYDESDDSARAVLSNAFAAASKLFGMAVPKHVELQLIQATTQGSGEAFAAFHSVANAEMSKVIVGQTLSAEGQNLGMGGGQASVQENVRQDIRQFDSRRLGHCLRTQLLRSLCQLNGWTGRPPLLAWGGESAAELTAIGAILPGLGQAGMEVSDDGIDVLASRLGFGLQRARVPAASGPAFAPMAASRRTPRHASAAHRRSEDARNANDQIAAAGADDYTAAMIDSMAPIAKLLSASDSMADFEQKLRARFPELPSRKAAAILEATLVANATNAILNQPATS